jgi:hypothetical protein
MYVSPLLWGLLGMAPAALDKIPAAPFPRAKAISGKGNRDAQDENDTKGLHSGGGDVADLVAKMRLEC